MWDVKIKNIEPKTPKTIYGYDTYSKYEWECPTCGFENTGEIDNSALVFWKERFLDGRDDGICNNCGRVFIIVFDIRGSASSPIEGDTS